MITEEINEIEIEKKNQELIKNLFSDITLPRDYFLEDNWIVYKNLLIKQKVALIEIVSGDTLRVLFDNENEYKNLRKLFDNSETKFILRLCV